MRISSPWLYSNIETTSPASSSVRGEVPFSDQITEQKLPPTSEREIRNENEFARSGLISIVHQESVESDFSTGQFGHIDATLARCPVRGPLCPQKSRNHQVLGVFDDSKIRCDTPSPHLAEIPRLHVVRRTDESSSD